MIKLNKINKPNTIYADVIEDGALDQFIEVMNHPSITRGALMPDVHKGYTLPIGGVVESKGMVFPSFVGYDLGCGMCAVATSFKLDDVQANGKRIHEGILDSIPVGFNKRSVTPVEAGNVQDMLKNATPTMREIYHEKKWTSATWYSRWRKSFYRNRL